MASTAGIRRWGAAALDLAYVAAGRFDGFWERGLSPWEYAAGMIVFREAGGYISEMNGKTVSLDSPSILASKNAIPRDLMKLLRTPLSNSKSNKSIPGGRSPGSPPPAAPCHSRG